nr:hypothetical protein [Ensifer sp. BR816]
MLTRFRKERLAHDRVNAVAGDDEISFDCFAACEIQYDTIVGLACADALHARPDHPFREFRKKRFVKVASMQHGHRQMSVTAPEFLEVGGLQHPSALVQQLELLDRLRRGSDQVIETKRAEAPKRIGAETKARSKRFERLGLFVNFRIPSNET